MWPVDVQRIRDRIRAGHYLIKSHAVQHALKEGFTRHNIVEAILTGRIIEEYPDQERVLICGTTTLPESVETYLHVVCEYADAVYVECVTAYIPDGVVWEKPPMRRREQTRN